jgi:glutathione peroxidase
VTLKDIALTTLDGKPATLAELSDGATLIVNVASKCGLTPQYTALEKLAPLAHPVDINEPVRSRLLI